MTRADSVLSTPRRTASKINPPIDTTRRRFITVAAVASVVSIGTLAVAAMPAGAPDSAACAADPAFALIAAKRAGRCALRSPDDKDEAERRGTGEEEAFQRCCVACVAVNEADWRLATTPPTTLAGVAAVLRFANEIEDGGMEWPDTDTIGSDGIISSGQPWPRRSRP
jgi:hypothetical protein